MNRNRMKKICIISVFMAVLMYVAVFKTNVFERFSTVDEQIGNSTIYDENQLAYVVTLKYMYQNGNMADSKDVYVYENGEDLNIQIPQLDGYTSNITAINETIDDSFLDRISNLDYVEITKQEGTNIYRIYYTITYIPAPSSYKVVHYLQNVDGSYDVRYEQTFSDNVFIGDNVSTEVIEYEGYTFNRDKSVIESSVNKDGTTELSLYYDRNYNYIYLDSNGGTYFEPISMIYEGNIDLSEYIPQRSGYSFLGWKCIDRDTGNVIQAPITMPNNDVYFRADWDIEQTSFTITYMIENANNDSYSNAGMYTVRNVESETLVSDVANLNNAIEQGFENIKGDEKDYFEYNELLSLPNFNVQVSGDGTTNVNVYYDRKEYTLRFMVGRTIIDEADWWWEDDEITYQIATQTGGSENACNWTQVNSAATINKNGNVYKNNEYTITAKYEAYLTDLWPTVSDVSNTTNGNTTYYFVSWGTSDDSIYWDTHTNKNVLGLYPIMSQELIIDPTNPSVEHELYGYWSTGPRYFRYHYMYEAFDQTTDTGSSYTNENTGENKFYVEDSTTIVRTTNVASGQNGPNFYGYNLIGKTYTQNNGGTQDNPTDIWFYYDRNEYDITLFNVSGEYNPSSIPEQLNKEGIYLENGRLYAKHGANISSLENLYQQWQEDLFNKFEYPLVTSETKERQFEDWYLDISNSIPMQWDNEADTVISSNLTLYANWKVPEFNVSFDVNDGVWNETDGSYVYENGTYNLSVSSGSTLVVPQQPTREGYEFKGWYYTDKDGKYIEYLFSASQKVYDNLVLEVNWEARDEGSYTVKYVLAQFDENGKLITDLDRYQNPEYLLPDKVVNNIKYGTTVTETAEYVERNGVNMLIVDGYSKQITLTTSQNPEDNVIYFFYTPQEKISYTIYYLLDTGKRYNNGDIPPEDEFLSPSIVKTVTSLDSLTITEESIEIDGYEVDSFIKSTVLEANSESLDSSDNSIFFYYSPVKRQGEYEVNFYFMKEDGTYPTTPDYTNSGTDSVGKYIYATDYYNYLPQDNPLYIGHEFDDKTTTALMAIVASGNKAVLNLYFKNSVYNVSYDTQGGEWTDTSNIYTQITQEIYQTNVNYNGVAPQPTLPTKENNRFLGWYDSATDKLYDFNTKVTQDVELYAKWIEQKDIIVQKTWNDNDDQDGLRPDEITVELKLNGVKFKDITLESENNWISYIQDLDKYDEHGNEIEYTVEELAVNGYTAQYSIKDNNTFVITNTHIPETKEITIEKRWEDNNNQDGLRPDSVQLELRVNENLYTKLELNSNNNWNTKIEVPVYQNGNVANYTIAETYVDGYTMNYQYSDNSIVVTNTHIPETKEITIEKKWEDNNDQDGLRPDSVSINIKNGEEIVRNVTLTDENWTKQVTDLPVYSNGNKIEYTIEESNVDGYSVSYINQGDKFIVTNIHIPETKDIVINKIWQDNNDQDGLRPGSINAVLKADGVLIENIELSETNNWQSIVEDLPVYENGILIDYTVDEEMTPEYTTSVEETQQGFNIINTHETKKTTLSVEKIWDDNNNQDGKRPTSLQIYLLANGEIADEITLSDENGWSYNWTSIDMYSQGEIIDYTVEEEVVQDYEVHMDYNDALRKWTITNVHEPEKKTINVTKVWDDNNDQDGKRPDELVITLTANGEYFKELVLNDENGWTSSFDNLDVYKDGNVINYEVNEPQVAQYTTSVQVTQDNYTFTNTHIPERADRVVKKVWRDGSNKENTRPDSVSFRLLKNGKYITDVITLTADNMVDNFDEWEYTFEDLFVYENGKKINYTVEEIEVPQGYGVIYNQENLTMYNAYPPELEVSVEKVWNDEENADGIRPEKISVQLYADGKPYEIDGQNIGYVELSEENNWHYTWGFIEKYNNNGERYNYTLEEVNVGNDGYTTDISVKDELNPEFQFTYVVTNTHVPEKISKTVTKIWDDNNNQDGKRPESVTVRLLANGKEVRNTTLSQDNGWTYTFEDVNVKENGQPIEYTVVEDSIDGYTPNIVDNGDNTFTITNTHIPQKRTINIQKVWQDNENQDGLRPNNIEVTLKADGEVKETFNITADENWKKIIENLDVYKNGDIIDYTLEETSVNGYSVEYQINGNEYKIINTHIPQKRTINIQKIWQDDNNRDGIRPANVVLTLKNGNEIIRDNIILNKSNNWTTQINELDKYQDGIEINYTLEEQRVSGYSTTYDYDLENNNITITNEHTPQTKTIKVTKEWNDEEDLYNKRPESIDIDLYANNTFLQTVSIEEASNWEVNIGGLYQKEDGKDINYTVVEHQNDYYTNTISYQEDNIILTNNIITFDITTNVNGIGGTVSGQGLEYYERVVNGDSTQKDIIITPNEGYKISKITINGVEQTLPQDTTVLYTLNKFSNVTENKQIIVEFEKIEYSITTQVIGENGTISGQDDETYEVVKHGENSQKPIIITPNEGYEISKISINGIEQSLPDDPTVAYTLSNFINVKENIHVTVEFKRTQAKVIVSYQTETGKKLTEDITIEGFIGDRYETQEKSFENYVLILKPENAIGIMDKAVTQVTYIYEYRPNICISKIVKGTYADIDKKFEFTVNISDGNSNYNGVIKYELLDSNNDVISQGEILDGHGTVYIGHNERVILYEIPEDLNYTIQELNAIDYDTQINGEYSESKAISDVITQNTTIEFINEKEYISPTGIVLNILPFVLGLIIVVIIGIIIRNKRRKNHDK